MMMGHVYALFCPLVLLLIKTEAAKGILPEGVNLQDTDITQFLLERVSQLELNAKKVGNLESRVNALENIVKRQDERISSQNEEIQRLKESVVQNEQESEVGQEETPINDNESNKHDSETEKSKIDGRPISQQLMTAGSRGIRQSQIEGVGFSAVLSHSVPHMNAHDVIKFDLVHLNAGNSYTPTTGVFACPQDGIYLFSFSICHSGSGQVFVDLMVDGQQKSAGTSESRDVGVEIQGGNTVVLYLTKGQQVWLEMMRSVDDNTLWAYHFYNSFSGVLIY